MRMAEKSWILISWRSWGVSGREEDELVDGQRDLSNGEIKGQCLEETKSSEWPS